MGDSGLKFSAEYFLLFLTIAIYPILMDTKVEDVPIREFVILFTVAVYFFSATYNKLSWYNDLSLSKVLLFFIIPLSVVYLRNAILGFGAGGEVLTFESSGLLFVDFYSIQDLKQNFGYYTRVLIYPILYFMIGLRCGASKNWYKYFFASSLVFLIVEFVVASYQYFYTVSFLGRPSGTFNEIGGAQMLACISFLYLSITYFYEKNVKVIYLYMVFVLIISIFSGTRSTLLLFPTLFFYKRFGKLFIITALLALAVSILLPGIGYDYVQVMYYEDPEFWNSSWERISLWKVFLDKIYDDPFWGIGSVPIVADNLLLWILGVWGVPGLIGLSLFLGKFVSKNNDSASFMVFLILAQGVAIVGLLSWDYLPISMFIFGVYYKNKYLNINVAEQNKVVGC